MNALVMPLSLEKTILSHPTTAPVLAAGSQPHWLDPTALPAEASLKLGPIGGRTVPLAPRFAALATRAPADAPTRGDGGDGGAEELDLKGLAAAAGDVVAWEAAAAGMGAAVEEEGRVAVAAGIAQRALLFLAGGCGGGRGVVFGGREGGGGGGALLAGGCSGVRDYGLWGGGCQGRGHW
jgi:hypothetical protein